MSFEERFFKEDGFAVRRLRPDDRQGVKDFFNDMDDRAAGFFNSGGGNERRVSEFFESGKPDHVFWALADAADSVAGIAFIWDLNKKIPWFGIAVSEKYRGRGLGSFFLESVETSCLNAGMGGILLRTHVSNLPAQRLYEKHGFERLGTHPSGEYLYLKRFELK